MARIYRHCHPYWVAFCYCKNKIWALVNNHPVGYSVPGYNQAVGLKLQPWVAIIKLPAKRSASNPLWVKVLNNKSPTIVTPIIIVQLDGVEEQMLSIPPDKTAPWSSSLTGGFKRIALVKPSLVMEITIEMLKSKSLIHQGASAKNKDLTNLMQKTPTNRNEGTWTRQEMLR